MSVAPRPLLSSVRIARGMTQEELSDRSGISQAVVSGLERGRLGLTETTLAPLAAALSVPTELLTQPKPATRIVARLQSSLPARVTRRLEADLALAHAHLDGLLGSAPDENVLPETDGSPAARAEQLRHAWGIATGPVENLVTLVESKGVICVIRDTRAIHLGAVGSWPANGRPVVLLDRGRSPRDRRFALAQELAFALGESAVDDFAAELLMPSADVKWNQAVPLTVERVGELESLWGVPATAILGHSRRCDKISATRYRSLLSEVRKRGTGSTPGRAEWPTVIADSVRSSLTAGLSREEIARSAFLDYASLRQSFLAGTGS